MRCPLLYQATCVTKPFQSPAELDSDNEATLACWAFFCGGRIGFSPYLVDLKYLRRAIGFRRSPLSLYAFRKTAEKLSAIGT
jgi:hypothetical protein